MSNTYSYAYADESGDTGYDLHHGGSTHFVLGIVLPADPEATIDRIVTLRRSLNKAATYEFHFHQADSRVCTQFFTKIPDQNDKILVAVVHKQFAPNDFRRLGRIVGCTAIL